MEQYTNCTFTEHLQTAALHKSCHQVILRKTVEWVTTQVLFFFCFILLQNFRMEVLRSSQPYTCPVGSFHFPSITCLTDMDNPLFGQEKLWTLFSGHHFRGFSKNANNLNHYVQSLIDFFFFGTSSGRGLAEKKGEHMPKRITEQRRWF